MEVSKSKSSCFICSLNLSVFSAPLGLPLKNLAIQATRCKVLMKRYIFYLLITMIAVVFGYDYIRFAGVGSTICSREDPPVNSVMTLLRMSGLLWKTVGDLFRA